MRPAKESPKDTSPSLLNDNDLNQLVNQHNAKDNWLLLLLFRCINAGLVWTFFQPDEYFQSLEPAWQMAFGPDSGAWITWVRVDPFCNTTWLNHTGMASPIKVVFASCSVCCGILCCEQADVVPGLFSPVQSHDLVHLAESGTSVSSCHSRLLYLAAF